MKLLRKQVNKKIIIAFIILIIILLGTVGYFIYTRTTQPTPSTQSELYNKETNGIKNNKLIQFARSYLQSNPEIYFNGLLITSSNMEKLEEIDFESSWFVMHDPEDIEYNPHGKWSSPYEYLNDKFIVYWRFMPGCEKRPEDKISKPNWFNKQGVQCVGGHSVNVILNSDLKCERVDISSLE